MHCRKSQVTALNYRTVSKAGVRVMSVTLAKLCKLSQAPPTPRALPPQPLGTCVGLLGWADGLIVTTWRQWEGLMRNICFCVSTELLIVQGKGYSAPIQTRHNENPSPPWASWAYNIHPLLFFTPNFFSHPFFLTLILHAFISFIVLKLHALSGQNEGQWCAKL